VAGLGSFFQKAVYLGVGLASYAGDKASQSLGELKDQAQGLADELVQRGEMTTEEARRLVDEMVNRSQATTVKAQVADEAQRTDNAPRKINIDFGADSDSGASKGSTTGSAAEQQQAEALRQQVEALQAQLERLKKSGS
jgi:polyhydroxyalkanoate synthesis regulator phasin